MDRDPRITPARPDLAAASLRGEIAAPRYAEPRRMHVRVFAAPVRRAPRRDAPLDTEALCGEAVDIYDVDDEGWAWGQLVADGYVGYLPHDDLDDGEPAASHRVAVPRTFIYPAPDIKVPPLGALPLNARVAAAQEAAAGSGAAGAAAARFLRLAGGGFVYAAHLAPLATPAPDAAAVAELFVGAPYLWGGRTALGVDCSGLVQMALWAAGVRCPRDSDMQMQATGAAPDTPRRGDLVFWRGHVGMMLDGERLIHANGHHMRVAVEPLETAAARIRAAGAGEIIALRRPAAG
ncbi:NlpC/P60 family protein [Camelimonas abortus]|uniref:NlpC/P60 family protein n=1 Tax=Camelimonas abortus TaxID=1017184 RepID=A0ABV7LFE0_9HYPH